jgi:cytochrome c biogenesis protein CcdA
MYPQSSISIGKSMKSKLKIVLGVLLIFIGIWTGAILMTIFPGYTAYNFASLVTGIAIVILGIWLLIVNK